MIAGMRHILRIIRHARTQTIINMSNRHVANIGAFERPADAASGAGAVDRKTISAPSASILFTRFAIAV
jgi:hypothetical protein